MKLSTKGSGRWATSGGDHAKFGLRIDEILACFKLLETESKTHWLKLLHFHIGSQITSIEAIKKALDEAKKLKKPIFLSVGYASCHWCHVMAHESFENKKTAEIMNKKFINIKVDREERPDLDNVFQKSLAILTGVPGGWPLSMFLDENAVPFSGGTYFPPQEMQGRPSFTNVLDQVSNFYEKYTIIL